MHMGGGRASPISNAGAVRVALAWVSTFALLYAVVLGAPTASGVELELRDTPDFRSPAAPRSSLPDQLPHSHIAQGGRDIASAWLAAPTRRYTHAVLGDELEASELRVRDRSGRTLIARASGDCVFEDLIPRLADVDGDGRDDVLVVQSCQQTGAMITVWHVAGGRLVLKAAGGAIGTPHRWLNPIGVGDFDGDGRLEIAVVVTPHIGGIVKIYRLAGTSLTLVAERGHYSTHIPGSTDLGLGQVFRLGESDALLVPDQARDHLAVLALRNGHIVELARIALGAALVSGLVPAGPGTWRFGLADGRAAEVSVR